MHYQTVTGQTLNFDRLTHFEIGVLRLQLELTRVPEILLLSPNNPLKEITAEQKEELFSSDVFLDTWKMLLRNRLSEEQRISIANGPLSTIIDDIVLRTEIIKNGWKDDFVRNDPRWVVSKFRSHCKSLGEFADKLELDPGQASRALKAIDRDLTTEEQSRGPETGLSIPTVRKAAAELEQIDLRTHLLSIERSISIRDQEMLALGFRLSYMYNVLHAFSFGDDEIKNLLYREVVCRTGNLSASSEVLDPLLSLARETWKRGRGCDWPERSIIRHLFPFTFEPVEDFKSFVQKYSWMIFGVEFNWFEYYGYIPLVLDSFSVEIWKGNQGTLWPQERAVRESSRTIAINRKGLTRDQSIQAHACYHEWVTTLLTGNWNASHEVLSEVQKDHLGIPWEEQFTELCRKRTELLLSCRGLDYHLLSVLGRWFGVLTGKIQSLPELVKSL